MQIAAWAPELSCRAWQSDCRLQTANAACRGSALAVFVRKIRKKRPRTPQNTQGPGPSPGPSADLRLQMQIAALYGEGSCRAGASLQISDCKCRLQHSTERGAAGQGSGSADPRLQMQIAARWGEGSCRDRIRCEKKTQNTNFVCRLQHFSLQMRSVRCHHSNIQDLKHHSQQVSNLYIQ